MSAPEPYVHRCVVKSGPSEGNKHSHEVTSFEIEYNIECSVCGEPLAGDLRAVVAHMYSELLGGA